MRGYRVIRFVFLVGLQARFRPVNRENGVSVIALTSICLSSVFVLVLWSGSCFYLVFGNLAEARQAAVTAPDGFVN